MFGDRGSKAKKNANIFNTEFYNEPEYNKESYRNSTDFDRNHSLPRKNQKHLNNSALKYSGSKKNYGANWRLNEYYVEDSEPSPIEVHKKLKELSSSPERFTSDKKPLNKNASNERLSLDFNPFSSKNNTKFDGHEEEADFVTPK